MLYCAVVAWFWFPSATSGQDRLQITEFLAANTRVLADEDGETSDWVEIHNPGPVAVNLLGTVERVVWSMGRERVEELEELVDIFSAPLRQCVTQEVVEVSVDPALDLLDAPRGRPPDAGDLPARLRG